MVCSVFSSRLLAGVVFGIANRSSQRPLGPAGRRYERGPSLAPAAVSDCRSPGGFDDKLNSHENGGEKPCTSHSPVESDSSDRTYSRNFKNTATRRRRLSAAKPKPKSSAPPAPSPR